MFLNVEAINTFANSFFDVLIDRRIDKYLEKESGDYQANVIHSGIIWSREIVECLNQQEYSDTKTMKTGDILLLISCVDILLESTEQIYRVLFKTKGKVDIDEESVFINRPVQYRSLSDRDYFKEIRAIFGAHPINLCDPQDKNKRRFADIPYKKNIMLINYPPINGYYDFYIKIWTSTYNDEDTIYVPLIVNEIFMFARLLVERFNIFNKRIEFLIEKNFYMEK